MINYYPISCERCKALIGYSDVDFKDNSNIITVVWCTGCVVIKPKEDIQ